MIKKETLRRHRWFFLFVVLPTFLATIYYGLIASDVYLSESRFVIRSPSQKSVQTSTLANLLQTTGLSTGQEQTNEVLDFIRSRDALKGLQGRIDVKERFASQGADRLSRYPQPFYSDAFENLYRFYRSMVDPRLDNDTGMAVLSVKAFSAKDARDLNMELLRLSEQLVNRLNERAHRQAIAESEQRVVEARARARAARLALGDYRNQAQLIDPSKQATGVLEVSNELLGQQTALQAQLNAMERATPRHPALPQLRARIAAISGQVAAQTGRVVGTRGGIASKLGAYENLALEQEFAAQILTASAATLEQARAEAQRQQFYLERVVEPNLPDLALYPNRLKMILTIAAIALCLYFIGWMLVVGILEHAPED
jgi:capsular polysaccharide transport system permease protein